MSTKSGIAGRIAGTFIESKLAPLLMVAFLGIGIYGAWLTPREEEPQIDVPIADIFVQYPGASPAEVERRIVEPLERIVSDIEGIEYIYSTSMPGQAMLIARFFVGQDVERSIVKLYDEIEKHMDQMPPGVTPPLIKTRAIDDVPIMALTLWSEQYDDFMLRRLALELSGEIKKIPDVASLNIIGGQTRQVRVVLDPDRLAGYMLDPLELATVITAANSQRATGSFNSGDTEFLVETGSFLTTSEEVENLVVGVHDGNPVHLKDVAEVIDGPENPIQYVGFGSGQSYDNGEKGPLGLAAAVTISIAKRRGTDAMRLASQISDKVAVLSPTLIPADVQITTTRNYGETASHKVFELLLHLLGSVIAVTIVVGLAMGWRGGLVVFLSVPITFALTLFIYYMFGYTLNRITLFALVFVTGIVVDDSIIIAENMHRHFKMGRMPFLQAALHSINEVGNPTILATFTVIAAVLPMAFVSGLMGPYMSPMPIGASMAMLFSLLVALVATPWLAYRFFSNENPSAGEEKAYSLEDSRIYRIYSAAIKPLMESLPLRWSFIGGTTLLLFGSVFLLVFKGVEVKMLPFDNKNEFQVIVDMPEGTTLERTAIVTRELATYMAEQKEVTHFQTYVGTAAPINFNGLVRHYDLRRGSNVADIQVNLVDKGDRDLQSHDIAKRVRPGLQEIASRYAANVKIAEVPPGPPVVATLVAEVYGPEYQQQVDVARQLKTLFEGTDGIVDVDWMVEDDQTEFKVDIDTEKAQLSGVAPVQIVEAMRLALNGANVAALYQETDIEQVFINLRLSRIDRSDLDDLTRLQVRSASGVLVPISDLVSISEQIQDKAIYHKNQKRVVYVTADVAGEIESPIYAMLDVSDRLESISLPAGYSLGELYTEQPFTEEEISMKWDGEWHITYEVFRDLGAAFAVALLFIYILIAGWFEDLKVPFILMVAIPLSLIGILFGHWIMGAFFTATSMIGTIALAGIMVRNSVLLMDFINLRLADDVPLKQAVIEAGAVRTMPILLTAGTVIIGAFVILFDPIFQGLAIALIGGSLVSTVLTLLIVPLLYYMMRSPKVEAKVVVETEQSIEEAGL